MLCVFVLRWLNAHLVCNCLYESPFACLCIFLSMCVYVFLLVCVSVCTGVEILRHVTAGGPMPTGKDEAEKEMTVATVTLSWSG